MAFSFKAWYEKNGDELNAKRKSRYHSDPEYRARVLAANHESRQRRRGIESAERQEQQKAIKIRTDRRQWKTVCVEHEGEQVIAYTIGALAKALGCSIQAVRLWEKQGVIAETPLRAGASASGDRLYTEEMVRSIRRKLLKEGRISDRAILGRSKPRSVRKRIRLANGEEVTETLFLIGALAKVVDRNVVTLEQLERRHALPKTPFRVSSVGRRLYTADMILSVKAAFEALEASPKTEKSWQNFYAQVYRAWQTQGVVGAQLLETVEESHEARR